MWVERADLCRQIGDWLNCADSLNDLAAHSYTLAGIGKPQGR